VPPEPDDVLAQQLRQLRREYLRDSSQRVEELHQLRTRLAQDAPAALADLRQAFHRLSGSGGSYGFPDVSARSREGEQLIVRLESLGTAPTPADVAAIDESVAGVADAFADARRAFGPEGGDKGS
jgi:HPt (histidine-containing phosphotransfer) domain-containing protein